jgi:hypothetical protein
VERVVGLLPVVARREREQLSGKVHRLEREKRDYVFCLGEAARQFNTSQGVLMVEDDSLPQPRLLHHLVALAGRRPRHGTAFIKLFHPPALQGFLQPEPHRWAEWLALALLLRPALPLLLGLPAAGLATRLGLLHLLLALLLLETAGRQSLLHLRPLYSLVPAPDCCTPANYYPAASLPAMLAALDSATCGPGLAKDYALVAVARRLGLQSWAVQPNLVTHNGAVSTLGTGVNLGIQP